MLLLPMFMRGNRLAPRLEALFLCNSSDDLTVANRTINHTVPANSIQGGSESTSGYFKYYLTQTTGSPVVFSCYCPQMTVDLAGMSAATLTVECWNQYYPPYLFNTSMAQAIGGGAYGGLTNYYNALGLHVSGNTGIGWTTNSSESFNSGANSSGYFRPYIQYNGTTTALSAGDVALQSCEQAGYTWHHLAITADGTNFSFFANGTRMAQASYTSVGWPSGSIAPTDLLCAAVVGYSAIRVSAGVRYSGTTYTMPPHPITT